MPQISYTADNTKAMVASAAFNFPDRNTMSFTCKIKLCYNSACKELTVSFLFLNEKKNRKKGLGDIL